MTTPVATPYCFGKAGFGRESSKFMEIESEKIASHSREFENAIQIEILEEFIDVDEKVQYYGKMTDAEVCEQVKLFIEEPTMEVDSVEIDGCSFRMYRPPMTLCKRYKN